MNLTLLRGGNVKFLPKLLCALLFFILAVFLGCQSQYMTAGKIYMDQDNYDAAIEQFKLAAEAEPQNPEPLIWLGKAYSKKKKFEEACKATEKALSLDPKKLEVLKNDMLLSYWAVFYNAGLTHVNNKEYDRAEKRLMRSLDFEPKNVQSMNLLAFCYIKLDRKDDAQKMYEKCIELVPNEIETYINYATFHRRYENYEEEEKILRKAKKIVDSPDWLKGISEEEKKKRKKSISTVYIELGNNLLRQEKSEEAEKVLAKAIEFSPDDKDVNYNYGVALIKLQKWQESVKPFETVISADSTDQDAHYFLGFSFLKLERYTEAIDEFTKVIGIDADYCSAYINRAFAERELGNTDAAYNDAKLGTECQKKIEDEDK
jgi:tetratricopeptide (TPR) repeat protein